MTVVPTAPLTISAVVTTYNQSAFLQEALASILSQTLPPDEILVVDDGSTDNTAEVMAGWSDRVTYHRQANAGVSAARNLGWRLAKGTWIAYLDDDDLWLPERLQIQVDWIREHPETTAVFGLAQNFAQPGKEALFDPEKHHLTEWLPGWLPTAALIRRDFLERTGGFDETLKFSEMVSWIALHREAGAIMGMPPVPVARRRLHGANKRLRDNNHINDLRLARTLIALRKAARESSSPLKP